MRFYLDTSVLVRALVREAGSEATQAWLAAQDAANCMISDWVLTEFSSALSLKLRAGMIEDLHRVAALATLGRLAAESLALLPVERRHFRTAARFVDRHDLGLRSGDALHLAVCADHSATLATLDRRLTQAARSLGVPVEVPEHPGPAGEPLASPGAAGT